MVIMTGIFFLRKILNVWNFLGLGMSPGSPRVEENPEHVTGAKFHLISSTDAKVCLRCALG